MKADAILRAGLDTLVQRGVKRDQPDGERSMPRIVRVYEAITGIRLTERQGLLFMVAMKLVREGRGEPDADDYIDLANYIALCGEAALATGKESLTVDPAKAAHRELRDLLRQRTEHMRASLYDVAKRERVCGACDGTGNCAIDRANWVPCPACRGLGLSRGHRRPAPRGPSTMDAHGNFSGPHGTHNILDVPEGCCPICVGTGYANQDTRELCHTCGGTGAD